MKRELNLQSFSLNLKIESQKNCRRGSNPSNVGSPITSQHKLTIHLFDFTLFSTTTRRKTFKETTQRTLHNDEPCLV